MSTILRDFFMKLETIDSSDNGVMYLKTIPVLDLSCFDSNKLKCITNILLHTDAETLKLLVIYLFWKYHNGIMNKLMRLIFFITYFNENVLPKM